MHRFAKDSSLRLSKDLSHDAINVLVRNGLGERYPDAVSSFIARERENEENNMRERKSRTDDITKSTDASFTKLRDALETHLVKLVLNTYPYVPTSIARTLLALIQYSKLNEDLLRARRGEGIPSNLTQDDSGGALS